jgi:hypothetical protein
MKHAEPGGTGSEQCVAIVAKVAVLPGPADDYVLVVTDRRLIVALSNADTGGRHPSAGAGMSVADPEFAVERFWIDISREGPSAVAARKGSISIAFGEILRLTMKRQRRGGFVHLMIRFRMPNRKERTVRMEVKPLSEVRERTADGASWLTNPASTPEDVQDLLRRRLPPALIGVSTWGA